MDMLDRRSWRAYGHGRREQGPLLMFIFHAVYSKEDQGRSRRRHQRHSLLWRKSRGMSLCNRLSLDDQEPHADWSMQQREAEQTISVVTAQLAAVADKVSDWSKIVIAYEPIWYVHLTGFEHFA